jgi:hypothetical protein
VLVLKSPGPNEKGVILVNYSYAFPLFLKHFDVRAVVRRVSTPLIGKGGLLGSAVGPGGVVNVPPALVARTQH